MRIGSLFTGIGGLDLAINHEHAWMCEYDPHCRRILEQRFPGVPCYPDVRELDAGTPTVDILAGGYPCQPFSVAGHRKGVDDPRHLWPHFARLIRLLRPRVVVAENVAGHLGLGFDTVLADIASVGMDVRWGVVRAADVGAPHQRARLFIVATDADDGRREQHHAGERRLPIAGAGSPPAPDPNDAGRSEQRRAGAARKALAAAERGGEVAPDAEHAEQPRIGEGARPPGGPDCSDCGVYAAAIVRWEHLTGRPAPAPTDDRGRLMPEFVEWMMGFPNGWTAGVARTQRLKMLGNAVVPQQAALALELLAFEASP